MSEEEQAGLTPVQQELEVDPRVILAAERTLLAWVRTGLAMMGFGFVVARFGLFMREVLFAHGTPVPPPQGISLWAGTGLVLLGAFVNLAATVSHSRRMRGLKRGVPLSTGFWSMGNITALLLAVIGLLTAVYLVFGVKT